jgi:hypothetical protein
MTLFCKPRKHLVRIFVTEAKSKVSPEYLFLRKGDEVQFRAVNTDVDLFFPQLSFYEGKVPRSSVDVPSGTSKVLTLKEVPDVKDDKGFPYAIYCGKTDDFVQINSSPTMIIDEEDEEGDG